jgi:hypothetical protein
MKSASRLATRRRTALAAVHELYQSMDGADYVVVDGVLFETDYLRLPDEFTVADDVMLEASHGDTAIDLTHGEVEGAEGLGQGVFRLRSGTLVRFLASAVVH